MGKIRTVLILLCCLSFTSCKVINAISIDYMLPADVSFPTEVKSVAVVNNTPQGEEPTIPTKEDHAGMPNMGNVGVFDGNAKLAAEELANNIAAGNYFDQVIICDSALRANDLLARETKLSRSEVRELSENLGVDMLLSLERVKIYFKKNMIYSEEIPIPQETLDATVSSMVRVYLPSRLEPLLSLNDRDSIYWVLGNWNVSKEVVDEASAFAAKLPVKHILPTWKSVDRYYYASGSVEMRDAAVYIRENNWDEAFKLWDKTYHLKSDKMRLRAAYNTALYYELKDQLENAKEWLEKAKGIAEKKMPKNERGEVMESTQDYALILFYMTDLNERIVNLQKLNLQMNRFTDDF